MLKWGVMTVFSNQIDRAAAWSRDRPLLTHVFGSLVLAVVCVLLLVVGDVGFVTGSEVSRWVFLAPITVATLASLLRVRAPGAAFALSLGAVALDLLLGGSSAVILYVVDGFYSASCYGGLRLRRIANALAVVGMLLSAVGLSLPDGDVRGMVFGALQGIAIFGTPVWWGANVRQRNEIAALGEQRLELERARTRDAQRIAELQRDDAVRSERAHMASELHDVVASRLSAIAIGSAAALGIPDADSATDPERARKLTAQRREVLETVRESSVSALDDMRSLITVLRAGDVGPHDAAAIDVSLDGIRSLDRAASGIHLDLELPDPEAYARLGEPLRQAVARIAGEIVANAVKHAHGCRLELCLDLGTNLRLTGRSTRGEASEHSVPSAGIGIRVMRERAEAFGGTLVAGPDGDGWVVDVTIPGVVEEETT